MLDFAAFLREAWSDPAVPGAQARTPYPWQDELARRCLEEGPPAVIAVPTGCGKTTTVDALVWALAAQADRPAIERTVGVRIVWAIDRRILVDEVHAHAQRLAARLQHAYGDADDVLHDIARRLVSIMRAPGTAASAQERPPTVDGARDAVHGTEPSPLIATRWRGGLALERELHHPLQPQIITSTIAQIGSRLLFRGYGVGRASLTLEAGLAGADTTICLDEAHLAEPFRRTVAQVRAHRDREPHGVAPGLRLVTLTATPSSDDEDILDISDADRAALGSRLTGQKVARLVTPDGDRDTDQERALREAIDGHLDQGAQTVACVVNSVRTARAVFDALRKQRQDVDALLLIGPQRPADRERVLEQFRGPLFDRETPEQPVVCVATQTFEVGLDADVEALVTQSASASALIQRLGRLNRRGDRTGRATIIRHEGFPLYEREEPAAWLWLEEMVGDDGTIDVSVGALREGLEPPEPEPTHSPTLTDATCEQLAQTSPRPAAWAEPDIEALLRGTASEPSADVSLCWRVDLRPEVRTRDGHEYREALLELVPPQPHELLTLSVGAARGLLAARLGSGRSRASGRRVAWADADIEGAPPPGDPTPLEGDGDRVPFLVLRGDELLEGQIDGMATSDGRDGVTIRGLVPGDLVVLPTEVGGIDAFGLAPDHAPATDVAADLRVPRTSADDTDDGTGTPVGAVSDPASAPVPVRLTFDALDAALRETMPDRRARGKEIRKLLGGDHGAAATERGLVAAGSRDEERAVALRKLLDKLAAIPATAAMTAEGVDLRRLDPEPQDLVWDLDEAIDELDDLDSDDPDDDLGLLGHGMELGTNAAENDDDLASDSSEDEPETPEDWPLDGWVLVPRRGVTREELRTPLDPPPTLAAHATAVTERATQYVRALALPPAVGNAVVLAARAHDHGKADRRMQAFFQGGAAAPLAVPLAKSVFGTVDRRAAHAAQRASGLPRGWRHEISSVEVLADALRRGTVEDLAPNTDTDLALQCVGGHHGHGLPLPPIPAAGGTPPEAFHVDLLGVAGSARGDGLAGWDHGEWLERFARMLDRYGPWALAYLQALLMCADRTVSAEGR